MTRLWLRTLLVTGRPDEVGPAVRRHREHLRELREAGKLRLAGELDGGDGFVEIFEAVDRREADAIGRASPLIEEGLVAWTVREWFETYRA
jgi:uncharacterized protein YciI